MEPLKVYEVDEARNEAMLRSDEPTAQGEALAYYEVRLHGLTAPSSAASPRRKAKPGREQVAFAITHETLAKLAGDIAA